MSYRIAGIDVHKKMLAVVMADVAGSGEFQFARRRFGATASELQALGQWLNEQQVEEVVMESTAQYWRPVWQSLEREWQSARRQCDGAGSLCGTLHLAQAESNRARRGRKNDWADAERLVKRLVAQELVLSLVPDGEQRLWRAVCRRKYQLLQNRVRLRNQLEGLLEEAELKLTSLVTDLFGVSGQRILEGLAKGITDPAALARLADVRLRATEPQLREALGACDRLEPAYRELLKMMLQEMKLIEKHTVKLDQQMARLLKAHADAVHRLAEVPGLGVDSGQQIIAQIGPRAAAFASAKRLSSWVGICPGQNISAEQSKSNRSAMGNRTLRRLLNQAAHAAVRTKGSIFELVYRRMIPRLGVNQTICAIAHRLCRLIWKVLHEGVRYQERGPAVSAKSQQLRTARMLRELRSLGYRVEAPSLQAEAAR